MSEPTVHDDSPNAERIAWWAGVVGQGWVADEASYDRMLAPVLDALVAHLDPRPGERILDVGAGTGTSTLAVADRVGPDGHVTAADVSTPMLARAAERVAAAGIDDRVELLEVDVQVHPFPPAAFDAVTSRFGVMFFADPTAAFANVHAATKDGGPSPLGDPHSLGDPDHVRRVLTDAGWRDVDLIPEEGELHLGGPGDLDHGIDFATGRGTVRARLADASEDVVAAAREAIADALAPRHDGTGVRLGYAAWIVTARR